MLKFIFNPSSRTLKRGKVLLKNGALANRSGDRNGRPRYTTAGSDSSDASFDVVIVGGGIVGLAAAQELSHRYPELTMALVEKEAELATHQSGHNSGVIHAGIYYKPGSLMAKLCVEGLHSTYKYCDRHSIPYKKCGKLVVATDATEIGRLDALFERATQNGVPDVELVDSDGIKQREPICEGLKALWSPHTGIVDWAQVAKKYGEEFEARGGRSYLGFEVREFREGADPARPIEVVGARSGQILRASRVLTCAGLQSDRVAQMSGNSTEPRIVPFRGEYLLLCPEKAAKINGNIYPVPDPRFPFLGVHFTPRMNGEVWLGPNAVLAFKREGYSWLDLSPGDLAEVLRYPGFYRLALKYLGYGSMEALKSLFPSLAVRELAKFVPDISRRDVSRGPAGVRAQAMNVEGDLVGDFVFESGLGSRVLHCRNAPSPGATSSLAIGRMMADKAAEEFDLPKRQNAELY